MVVLRIEECDDFVSYYFFVTTTEIDAEFLLAETTAFYWGFVLCTAEDFVEIVEGWFVF